MKRIEHEDIIRTYHETKSVWKTGKLLGTNGQNVHRRLQRLGVQMVGNTVWEDDEIAELRAMVEGSVSITNMADRLNRTYAAVACKLNEIGITNYRKVRNKPVKQRAGYDKKSIKKHLAALLENPKLKITQYARSVSLNVDSVVYALQLHYPKQFAKYLENHHGDLKRRLCRGCNAPFLPASGKQKYCNRQCAVSYLVDQKYFGGKRMTAVGAIERQCQLCDRINPKIIHVHHVIGKVNDPDNKHMVALCPGCHRLVGLAARIKGLVDNQQAWKKLMRLAWFEAHGNEFAKMDVLPDLPT
jgi:hypothetical protein